MMWIIVYLRVIAESYVKEPSLPVLQALVCTFGKRCGVSRIRTGDPLLAKQVLYQLSYNPLPIWDVGLGIFD